MERVGGDGGLSRCELSQSKSRTLSDVRGVRVNRGSYSDSGTWGYGVSRNPIPTPGHEGCGYE